MMINVTLNAGSVRINPVGRSRVAAPPQSYGDCSDRHWRHEPTELRPQHQVSLRPRRQPASPPRPGRGLDSRTSSRAPASSLRAHGRKSDGFSATRDPLAVRIGWASQENVEVVQRVTHPARHSGIRISSQGRENRVRHSSVDLSVDPCEMSETCGDKASDRRR
jgi:hypothetical protein